MPLKKEELSDITKVGHRGFRINVDENTFDSFDKAIEMGMDIIECDVRLSKDLQMVIIHDDSVDRTMNGSGKLEDLTLSELKSLKGKVHGFSIPTAEELIKSYANRIKLMIEIKDNRVPEDLANLVINLKVKDNIIFSGRNPEEFRRIQKIIPDAKFCHNITNGKYYSEKQFLKANSISDLPLKFDMISLSVQRMNKKFVNKCNELEILPFCWNLLPEKSPEKTIRKMMKLGSKGILFDDPETFDLN